MCGTTWRRRRPLATACVCRSPLPRRADALAYCSAAAQPAWDESRGMTPRADARAAGRIVRHALPLLIQADVSPLDRRLGHCRTHAPDGVRFAYDIGVLLSLFLHDHDRRILIAERRESAFTHQLGNFVEAGSVGLATDDLDHVDHLARAAVADCAI